MPVQGPPEPLLERIAAMRDAGPSSSRRIAATITRSPMYAARSGIVMLAQASDTSVGSVNRFCRALGLDGYKELRLALATSAGRSDGSGAPDIDPTGSIDPETGAEEAVQLIAASSRAAISRTADLLDLELLDCLAEAVEKARLVQLVAFGGSAHIASYLVDQLNGIGIRTLSSPDVNTAASIAATLTEADVLIAISHSGTARHAVEATTIGAEHGAMTAAITSSAASPLARAARVALVTTARTSTERYRGTAGRHAQLFVIDALYVRIAQGRNEIAERLLDEAGAATAPYQLTYRSPTIRPSQRSREQGSPPGTKGPTT